MIDRLLLTSKLIDWTTNQMMCNLPKDRALGRLLDRLENDDYGEPLGIDNEGGRSLEPTPIMTLPKLTSRSSSSPDSLDTDRRDGASVTKPNSCLLTSPGNARPISSHLVHSMNKDSQTTIRKSQHDDNYGPLPRSESKPLNTIGLLAQPIGIISRPSLSREHSALDPDRPDSSSPLARKHHQYASPALFPVSSPGADSIGSHQAGSINNASMPLLRIFMQRKQRLDRLSEDLMRLQHAPRPLSLSSRPILYSKDPASSRPSKVQRVGVDRNANVSVHPQVDAHSNSGVPSLINVPRHVAPISAITIPNRRLLEDTTANPSRKRKANSDAKLEAERSPCYDLQKGRSRLLLLACDFDTLSTYQCLLRQNIEFFEATEQDINSITKGRNKPVFFGQVGIRCIHCRHMDPKSRPQGATYYPAKIDSTYEAAQRSSKHLCYTCPSIPHKIRQNLLLMKREKSAPGGGKTYWNDATRIVCVEAEGGGLKFRSNTN